MSIKDIFDIQIQIKSYILISSSNFKPSNMIIIPFGMKFFLPNQSFFYIFLLRIRNNISLYLSIRYYFVTTCSLSLFSYFSPKFQFSFICSQRVSEFSRNSDRCVRVFSQMSCTCYFRFVLNLLYSTHDYCNIYATYI